MARKPEYARHLSTEDGLIGFSSIAAGFWRTAEKLRNEALQQTAKQSPPTHWNTHSAICLYHAALDSFLNEEITIWGMLTNTSLAKGGHQIQGLTLNAQKLNEFFSFFGLKDRKTPAISHRASLLAGLRNRLSHHWPEVRDMRDYPVEVINALSDARIEPVNTSWAAQCSDVRLAEWAADIVRAFVDEWWRIGPRHSDEIDRLRWVFGPDWINPSDEPAASKS
jgi:hypothetical protein